MSVPEQTLVEVLALVLAKHPQYLERLSALGQSGSATAPRPAPATPRILQARTRLGDFYLVENDAITRHLVTDDILEQHFYELTRLLLKDTDNVLDLGANVGTHTIWMSKILPQGKVFAFEPLSLTHSQLQLNVLSNGAGNVRLFKLAVSDSTGQYVSMEPIDYGSSDLNVGATRVSAGGSGDGTLTLRLDDLGLPPIAFIKMDIQGSEYRALLGMEALLKRDRPLVFVEIEEHHLRACGTSSKQLIEHFFARDYVLFRIVTNYPCDHLAVPRERADAIQAQLAASGYSYPTTRLEGREIDLTFVGHSPNYSTYVLR